MIDILEMGIRDKPLSTSSLKSLAGLTPFDSNTLWENSKKHICCHNLTKNVAMQTISMDKYKSYKAQASTWEAGILPLNYARLDFP